MKTEPVRGGAVEGAKGKTIYPDPFSQVVAGRTKRKLGDVFGLTNFGINLTHLEPGAASALFHWHQLQDEFIYVLEGTATVVFGEQEFSLVPGDCMGFKAGTGVAHQVVNRSEVPVSYIEVGDRTSGEGGGYPNDDLAARAGADGSWIFTHKDGTPY
jgi:uncharacterized cupin superfamily protein